MSVSFWNERPKKIPLLIVLVTAFVTLNLLAVGLVGYLSFRNGQGAVNDVARQLRSEVTTRIEEHLFTFLNTPYQINQTNASLFRKNILATNDAIALEHHFWEQIQIFDSVSSIYFGNTEGGLADAGREGAGGFLYVISTDGFVSGPFKKYATDSRGRRTDLLVTVSDFDARTRPWYIGAVNKGDAVWSEAYILFTGQDMAIPASRPVYNEQQELLGVVSVDLFLSHLSSFLQSLEIGKTGQAFIMERSGLLIASSTEEKPFTEQDEHETQQRLYANESANLLIRYAAEALTARFGDYHHIAETQYVEFEIDGRRQFLQVSPIDNKDGLSWLIIVVIPEADFMARINTNNRATIFLIIVALVVAIVVSIITTRKIIGPILELSTFAQALSKGEWGQLISYDSRISEISTLTGSFNHMAGQLQQMVAELTTEVAERKQAEEALRESEDKFKSIFENKGTATGIFGEDSLLTDCNAMLADMSGYSKSEIIDKMKWSDFVAKEDLERMQKYHSQRLKNDDPPPSQYECSIINRSGELINVIVNIALIGENRIVSLADITGRKRAEQSLAAEKERLTVTLRSIGDGVITTNIQGNIVIMNKVAEKLTGWTQNEAEGKPLSAIFFIIDELTRHPREDIAAKVLTSGEIIELANHTILVSRNGTERIIADSAAPIRDRNGETIGVVLVFRDMTEKLKTEQELLKIKKLESVGVLAGGIAHDFNNLLTGLFGNIEMAKIFLPADHKSRRFLETAGRSMENATNLTQQLLTFAKGGDPIKEILSIGEVITETAQFSIRGSNAKLQCNIPPDLWPVEADKGQLGQVIGNLVINAQQAMPAGGAITIVADNIEFSEGRYVQITVQDEGVGIAPQYLDKIFDPYFSTKQKGSGLGLASTHSIISKHNGTITVASQLNQGTIFTILLPAAEEKEKIVTKKPTMKSPVTPVFSARVLVLEDEETIREVLEAMLEKLEHKVTFAVEGLEAIAEYRAAFEKDVSYDVVITDLTIPGGVGGREAAEGILKIDPLAKIIVSSGYATDPIMANFEAYGFKGIAVKPYRFADLEDVVRRVLSM